MKKGRRYREMGVYRMVQVENILDRNVEILLFSNDLFEVWPLCYAYIIVAWKAENKMNN